MLRRLALLPALLACVLGSVAALAPTPARATDDTLPLPVRLALDGNRIPGAAVSVWVQPIDATQPSLSVNAAAERNPASVMKLITAFAALERLGPAHTWRTRIATTGTLRDGVLAGDLYLIGGGDPLLDHVRLWKMLRRLRGLGVRHIEGDIVLDASIFRLPPHDPAAFDGRPLRPYNSGPHGLLLHFNTLQLGLFPGQAANATVQVVAEPPLAGITIDNRILASAEPCGVWYRDLQVSIEGDRRLVLSGTLPVSCGPRVWSAAPLAPAEFGNALVAGLWSELGGSLGGSVRGGTVSGAAQEWLTEDSPSMAEALREMNKWSSNVIARQLLATLGQAAQTGASQAETDMVGLGARAAVEQLTTAGINTTGLVIENGSGLSRAERSTARMLGQILLTAWRRPWMPEYLAALPIAGVDGTARRRLAGNAAQGQAHIKTGSLNGVRAIGGYLLDRHGRWHALVMIVNHDEAASADAALDALLAWLWEGGSAGSRAR